MKAMSEQNRFMTGVIFLIFGFLSGTHTAPAHAVSLEETEKKPAEIIAEEIDFSTSDFDGVDIYDAPIIGPNLHDYGSSHWLLASISTKDPTEKKYSLRIVVIYFSNDFDGEWAEFKTASDRNANSFEVLLVDADTRETDQAQTRGTQMNEVLIIELDPQYIEERADSGLEFRIEASLRAAPNFILKVPPNYVQAMLMRMDPAYTPLPADSMVDCEVGDNPSVVVTLAQCTALEGAVVGIS